MTKCKLYNTTDTQDIFSLGSPIRYSTNVRDMYYEAYRLSRKAYHTGKELELLVYGDNDFSCTLLVREFGMLFTKYGKSAWLKERD